VWRVEGREEREAGMEGRIVQSLGFKVQSRAARGVRHGGLLFSGFHHKTGKRHELREFSPMGFQGAEETGTPQSFSPPMGEGRKGVNREILELRERGRAAEVRLPYRKLSLSGGGEFSSASLPRRLR